MSVNRILKVICTVAIAIQVMACGSDKEEREESTVLKVVCTTGMIGNAAEIITGGRMDITTLMGPGVDPHLYKPTQSDIENLMEADIIIYNGLHLEGKMGEIFHKLENKKHIIVMAKGLADAEVRKTAEFQSGEDPHIWFNVKYWDGAIGHLTTELIRIDSDNNGFYMDNYKRYHEELKELHEWTIGQINTISEDQRILITAHDAFSYFGDAYGMKVRGLQGISTSSEFGLKDRIELSKYIIENKIKAVFVESSVPKKSIEAVMESCKDGGHTVVLGGELYSDALGSADSEAAEYIGMVKANVNTIVNALK